MKWDEFCDLLVGIGPETPLGRVVAIRSEDDREILKQFTREQHRIRNEWRIQRAKTVDSQNMEDALSMFKNAFISLAKEVR